MFNLNFPINPPESSVRVVVAAGYQTELERIVANLKEELARAKLLSGLLVICSCCKKIRDDHGYWNQLEVYIQEHSDASFTHSFCPDCVRKLYPEIFAEIKS